MLPAEIAQVKQTAPSERADFCEAFWRARNPDPASSKIAVRSELERRLPTLPARRRIAASDRTCLYGVGRPGPPLNQILRLVSLGIDFERQSTGAASDVTGEDE